MNISREKAAELQAIVEDTLEYYCDNQTVSGELAWTLLECLGTAKLAEMNGELQ